VIEYVFIFYIIIILILLSLTLVLHMVLRCNFFLAEYSVIPFLRCDSSFYLLVLLCSFLPILLRSLLLLWLLLLGPRLSF